MKSFSDYFSFQLICLLLSLSACFSFYCKLRKKITIEPPLTATPFDIHRPPLSIYNGHPFRYTTATPVDTQRPPLSIYNGTPFDIQRPPLSIYNGHPFRYTTATPFDIQRTPLSVPADSPYRLLPSLLNSTTAISPQWQRPLKRVPTAKSTSRQRTINQRLISVVSNGVYFAAQNCHLLRGVGAVNRGMQIHWSLPFFRQIRRSGKIFVNWIRNHNLIRKKKCKGSKVIW